MCHRGYKATRWHIWYASSIGKGLFILDVIKYCDHPRWCEKIPPGGGTSDRRWDLQSEVTSLIRGDTSDWRWDLQLERDLWLEVGPPIGGDTSDWRWDLQLEVTPLIRDVTSDWRWHLWLEVSPSIGGETSDQRWLMHAGPHMGTHVTCRNWLFFWKKERDYLLLITSSHHLSTRWNVNLFYSLLPE